ncbi:MAG: pyruvate dehydrogenase complex dihydrolipoamide acetyltransferase [Proteobacteria bacterium]|nr:pyruvate dehydrogenase complex dihydrolipoamide acetyltransferase [Pseudomonadota bacterium]
MPIKILMPALSPTMTEGTLAKWLKAEGDQISSGEAIAEIETDKATMEVEAADDGVLAKIVVAEGTEGVKVNQLIAVLKEEGDDDAAVAAAVSGAPGNGGARPAPRPAAEARPAPPPPAKAEAAPAPPPPAPAPVAAPAAPAAGAEGEGRIVASPLARRMAEQAGLDLSRLRGSGPHGRIVKADIEAALAAGPIPAPAAGAPLARAPVPSERGPEPAFEEVRLSTMRKVIARRLTDAKQTIPHFYLGIDCEIDALLEMRKTLNAKSPEGAGAYKLSVNDFVIRAVALALRKVPAANASWAESAVHRYTDIDVSVAVATPQGLITPVIKHADRKGLVEISNAMKELAARAREGKLLPEEYQGGGFTISNLGMYGIREFAAIINPPQACILAVGAGEQRPVVKAGALAIATVMTCTLSTDHRVVDGAIGAEFLAAFKALIEDPLTMLL